MTNPSPSPLCPPFTSTSPSHFATQPFRCSRARSEHRPTLGDARAGRGVLGPSHPGEHRCDHRRVLRQRGRAPRPHVCPRQHLSPLLSPHISPHLSQHLSTLAASCPQPLRSRFTGALRRSLPVASHFIVDSHDGLFSGLAGRLTQRRLCCMPPATGRDSCKRSSPHLELRTRCKSSVRSWLPTSPSGRRLVWLGSTTGLPGVTSWHSVRRLLSCFALAVLPRCRHGPFRAQSCRREESHALSFRSIQLKEEQWELWNFGWQQLYLIG